MNSIFHLRAQAWFDLVLNVGLDLEDYWRRYEFAKSRGAIHFHAVLYARGQICRPIQGLFNLSMKVFSQDPMSEIMVAEDEVALCIQDVLKQGIILVTAEHTSGRERSYPEIPCNTAWYTARCACAEGTMADERRRLIVYGDNDVSVDQVGNVDQWPQHEGICGRSTGSEASYAIRRPRFQVLPDNDGVDTLQAAEGRDMVSSTNRTSMHVCSDYCLEADPHRKDGYGKPVRVCRMFFRDENKNVKAHTDGKLCSNKTRLTFRNGIIRMETARDHPRLLQGNASLTRAYSGNQDFQFILGPDKDTDTLGKEESIFDY